jgi:hypothetical protein
MHKHNENPCPREGIPMSICFSGLDTPCWVQPVTIDVSPTHPLLQLARVLPWQALTDRPTVSLLMILLTDGVSF